MNWREMTAADIEAHNAKVARDARAARITTGGTRTTAPGPAASGEVSAIPTVQNAHSCAQEPAVAVLDPKSTTSTHEDHFDRKARHPEPESSICDEPLEESEGKKGNAGRVLVRIVSYRRRLMDTDNLCGKYVLDFCRYAGFIKDDREQDIEYSISQTKVAAKEEERTEITIEKPNKMGYWT